MAVPGRSDARNAPADLAGRELFAVDAYLHEFEASIEQVDAENNRVALSRTAFYPGGGGQPFDTGWLDAAGVQLPVVGVRREGGRIWHTLATDDLPAPGTGVFGRLDWDRRHLVMRTHTALHILCGVVWSEFAIPVTGGNMDPGKGRLDFPLESMSAELGARLESRINEEIARAREIVVDFLPRGAADEDPALIRTAANLIPQEIDPLRVIDIVGLDKQADGGTHVLSTAEVGGVRVAGTESKGRGNKRVRIEVVDPPR
jgi:misacylated tRNA(Ala) deacylase